MKTYSSFPDDELHVKFCVADWFFSTLQLSRSGLNLICHHRRFTLQVKRSNPKTWCECVCTNYYAALLLEIIFPRIAVFLELKNEVWKRVTLPPCWDVVVVVFAADAHWCQKTYFNLTINFFRIFWGFFSELFSLLQLNGYILMEFFFQKSRK